MINDYFDKREDSLSQESDKESDFIKKVDKEGDKESMGSSNN